MDILSEISVLRKTSQHNTYIFIGQLNSVTHEPIDSYTLFEHFQHNNIPSKFVLWKKHPLYSKISSNNVIGLDGNGVDDLEFAQKCKTALVNAKAVIQEIAAINKNIKTFLKNCYDLNYVFLNHGIFQNHWLPSYENVLTQFNYVNVSSIKEQQYISNKVSKAFYSQFNNNPFIIGGLPRLDKLQHTIRTNTQKTIFVMLTYRSSFSRHDSEYFYASEYYRNLKAFLTGTIQQKLKANNIQLVLCPHHHLANTLKNFSFNMPQIKVADTTKVSYWIKNSDLCITDFSSVSFDFLYQNKPVIYWQTDINDAKLDADDKLKVANANNDLVSRFNVVYTIDQLNALITQYIDNGFTTDKKCIEFTNSCFQYKTNICMHLANKLLTI